MTHSAFTITAPGWYEPTGHLWVYGRGYGKRKDGGMIIGSFNVENLFDRAKALNQATWKQGAPVLAAHAELGQLLERDPYSEPDKARILELVEFLGIRRQDEGEFVRLRKIRGALLRRPRDRTKPVTVVAHGRSAWIGWVELKTEHVDELAMEHTAMVIRDVGADVLGVVEAEARPVLDLFTASMLKKVGGAPYDQVLLIDGNDGRGIDVGLLSRLPIAGVRTHIYDTDHIGTVFSRDCCEYHLELGDGRTLVVLVNHLKSKGYGSKEDPIGAKRRHRQATRIGEIYNALIAEGYPLVAVVGDLNDTPDSGALQPLLGATTLRDISEHPRFDPGPRKGTFKGENNQIDYVLLSPDLFAVAKGGGIFRKGIWRGNRTKNRWDIYPTLTGEEHSASDHAAIWAEIDL